MTSLRWPGARGWVATFWIAALSFNPRLLPIDGGIAGLAALTLAVASLGLALASGKVRGNAASARAPAHLLLGLGLALVWIAGVHGSREPQLLLGLALAAAWLLLPSEASERLLRAPISAFAVFATLAVSDDLLLWSSRASAWVAAATYNIRELNGGRTIHGGLETTGLWLLPAALALWWALLREQDRRGRVWISAFLSVGLVASAIARMITLGWWIVPAYMALATLAAAAIPPKKHHGEITEGNTGAFGRFKGVAPAALALLAAGLPLTLQVPEPGTGTVYVHQEVEVSLTPLAWDQPDDNQPKVGRWMRYLERSRVPFQRVSGPLAGLSLQPGDALVLVDYTGKVTDPDAAAMEAFVRGGGSLVLFADHTNMYGIADRYNRLLTYTHMRVVDDTAVPTRNFWSDAMALRLHPTTAGGVTPRQVSFGQGSSLEASWPARPLVAGRWAISDAADWTAPHRLFLGDRIWDRLTERRDGLLLAAEERVDRGKVLLYGDTSFLQDSSFSYCWPYLDRLIAYALSDAGAGIAGSLTVALLLLALGMALPLLHGGRVFALVALVTALSFGALGLERGTILTSSWRPLLKAEARVAEIPMAGVPSFDLFSDERGIDRFLQDLEKSGWLPLLTTSQTADRLPGVGLRVLLPRAAPVHRHEMRRWLSDLESGTLLWVAAGAPEWPSVEPLAQALGVGVEYRPLGRQFGERGRLGVPVPSFSERWPLVLPENAEVWTEAFGRPVIARLRRGEGQVLWIADGKLFFNPSYQDIERNSVFVRVASLIGIREESAP